jgi:hypothetical protein
MGENIACCVVNWQGDTHYELSALLRVEPWHVAGASGKGGVFRGVHIRDPGPCHSPFATHHNNLWGKQISPARFSLLPLINHTAQMPQYQLRLVFASWPLGEMSYLLFNSALWCGRKAACRYKVIV